METDAPQDEENRAFLRPAETLKLQESQQFIAGMRPEARKAYDEEVAKHGGVQFIINVDPKVRYPSDIGSIRPPGTYDRPEYVISTAAIEWTPALGKLLLSTDQEMENGYPKAPAGTQAAVDQLVMRAGLPPVTAIVMPPGLDDVGKTGMFFSREGRGYMLIEKELLDDPTLPGVIGHELGHYAKMEENFVLRAQQYNAPEQALQIQRAMENAADLYAVELGVGEELAKNLVGAMADEKYKQAKEGRTLDEHFKNYNHPDLRHRVGSVVEAMRQMEADETSPMTEEKMRKKLVTDAELAKVQRVRDPELLAAYDQMVEKLGIEPKPVFVESLFGIVQNAFSGVTKEGTAFVIIQPFGDKQQLMGLVAHELGHIKNGDGLPAAVTAAINDVMLARARETRADDTALDLCMGRPLARGIEMAYNLSILAAREEGKTLAEYALTHAGDHPPIDQRLERLVAETLAREDSGQCPNPEAPPTTPNLKAGDGKGQGR